MRREWYCFRIILWVTTIVLLIFVHNLFCFMAWCTLFILAILFHPRKNWLLFLLLHWLCLCLVRPVKETGFLAINLFLWRAFFACFHWSMWHVQIVNFFLGFFFMRTLVFLVWFPNTGTKQCWQLMNRPLSWLDLLWSLSRLRVCTSNWLGLN